MEKEFEPLGFVNLPYQGQVIPQVGIVKVTVHWDKGDTSEYFATQAIEALDLPAEKIQLRPLRGMSTDFDTVIKPLFEGESVSLSLPSQKTGKPYDVVLTFDAAGEAYSKSGKTPWYQGNLDRSFPNSGGVLPPMQSVGRADVWYDEERFEDIEIFKASPDEKKAYYTCDIPDVVRPGKVRMYLRKGMSDDFETAIKPWFEGKSVSQTLKSNAGKEYTAEFLFDPHQVPSFVEAGKTAPFTGGFDLEFS